MTRVNVVGIDPGPVPGVVVLQVNNRALIHVEVVQCSASLAPEILRTLLEGLGAGVVPTWLQLERFVVGRRSSRSSTAAAGQTTRDLVGQLEQVAATEGAFSIQRSAAQVKPWATDQRLERAGLLDATKGMRHAKDAARHALYRAVHDGGLTDPLSKEWRTA
jgi:hypothetical protein